MTILSQSFFTLVRRNFMTLPLFTTRHNQVFLLLNNLFIINEVVEPACGWIDENAKINIPIISYDQMNKDFFFSNSKTFIKVK